MDKVYSIVRIDSDVKGRIIAWSTESTYANSELAWEHMRRRHYTLLKEYDASYVYIAKRYGGAYDIRLTYKTNISVIETAWIVQENIVHHSFVTVRLES